MSPLRYLRICLPKASTAQASLAAFHDKSVRTMPRASFASCLEK
jgi:hypothetical protein